MSALWAYCVTVLAVQPWLVAVTALVVANPLLADERYAAWLSDGTKVSAKTLAQWPVPGTPSLWGERDLLAAGNFARLVRDRQAQVALAPPYIELANGDVLRGTPVELERGSELVGAPRLTVQLEAPLLPVAGTTVSVRTERVRRMVLSTGAGRSMAPSYEVDGGGVVLADGRRLAARSIRWRGHSLAVLTSEGITEVSFGDLAEVVFPGVNVTKAVLDDNLWAAGVGQSSALSHETAAIARIQLTSGTVVTASRISREQEQSRRRGRLTSATYYYVQPAWAGEPIAMPEEEIAAIGYRAADEAPLSMLPSQTLASRRLLAPASSPGTDRTKPVMTSGRASDLGMETHAESAIAFELPAAAKSLEVAVGFSPEVGTGGCVRCKVMTNELADMPAAGRNMAPSHGERVLWDSGVFEGKDGLKASGPLDVKGISRVVLVTEFAHEDRPSGADPFDIRDKVVWMAPLVRLDFGEGATDKRATALLPGMGEWKLSGSGERNTQFGSRWNVAASQWDSLVVLPPNGELVLTRKHVVSAESDVVELLTACPTELADHNFELKVNGERVPWHNNADRNQLRQWVLRYGRQRAAQGDEGAATADRLAYWWDLQAWRGQEVELELKLKGRGERSEVAWRHLEMRSAIAKRPENGELLMPDVPLSELSPRDDAEGDEKAIRFLGQSFPGGHRLARGSRVRFDVPEGCDRFIAVAGCSWQTTGPLRVLVDGQVAWERAALNSLDPAELIEVAIGAGAKTLTLEIASEGTHYGYAAFANAGFMKRQ